MLNHKASAIMEETEPSYCGSDHILIFKYTFIISKLQLCEIRQNHWDFSVHHASSEDVSVDKRSDSFLCEFYVHVHFNLVNKK